MWVGWVGGEDGAWERVCEAEDLSTCVRRLGAVGRERDIPTRAQVMTGGAAPTFRVFNSPSPNGAGEKEGSP
jgi:hypothetical protein